MAHQIEEFGERAAFVSVRQDAWHKLGTVVDKELSAEEALTYAHLAGWDVRKENIFLADGTKVPDRFATVRNNPFTAGQNDVLGVVGSKYEPIQNEDHADLLDALVGESGAYFETAGSLYNGKQTFITMKLPDTIQIGGVDKIETYIAALNSHDGSRAFQFIVTPVRIVCANTQAAALQAAKSRFSVRHTKSGADGIILQARETLGMTFKYLTQFQMEAEKMIQTEMTDGKFFEIVEQLYATPEDSSDIIKLRTDNHRTKIMELFQESSTMTEIRGTVWSGYQAVTEYLDHFVSVQGKSSEQIEMHRALAVANGMNDDRKNKAFQLLVASI